MILDRMKLRYNLIIRMIKQICELIFYWSIIKKSKNGLKLLVLIGTRIWD